MELLTDAWWWITDLGNSKILALLIFFTTFVGILLYVYSNRARSERLESYRSIPLMDDDDDARIPHNAAKQPPKGEK